MSFIIKGNLKGKLCSDCELPVSGVSIRLYKTADRNTETALATADPKHTFHQLTDEELRAREKLFLAEGNLQDNGDFAVTISEKSGYTGGVVDVDWYCGNTPVKVSPGHRKDISLQFHITTLQPQWKKTEHGIFAYFAYSIDNKWFCRILTLLDIWVVCGLVTDCKTKDPIPGVQVFAYDVDIIEDDFLGSAYTDANGKFTIIYPGANFRQTLLSPLLNVEWPAGPDYYFKIASSSGAILLQEDRTRGRQNDRHNAHNCFCVKLCITDAGGLVADTPWFTSVGYFSITSQITTSGKTLNAVSGAGGIDYGFFGSTKLGGYATKKVPTAPSSPLWYRFLYSLDNVNYSPVTEAQMEATQLKVATREIIWDGTTAFQNVVIDKNQAASIPDSIPPDNYPNPIPDHVLRLDADGWVRVDQVCMDNGFIGPMMWLNTNTVIGGGDASTGLTTGVPLTAAQQMDGALLYLKFQTTDDPANPGSPNLNTQAIIGTIYVNNWNAVNMLKMPELSAGGGSGCTPITTQAHVAYTADHEFMSSWSLAAASNAIADITGLPSGNVPRGEANIINLVTLASLSPAFNTWPSCAYSLVLSTVRKLTTGEENDLGTNSQVIFCR